MTTSLIFQNTNFDIIDCNGLPWLRLPQIGAALGYANPYKVQQVYDRNKSEFTESMTSLVELDTAGGKQQVRIFSLRGAHLLGMLAKTKIAKAFRSWVLDALEALSKKEGPKKALPLTPAQQHHIQARVSELAKIKGNSYQSIYSGIKFAFRVGTYKDVTQNQYPSLCKHLGTQPLEGEYLPEGGQQLAITDLPEVNVREQMLGWMTSTTPLDGDLLAQVEEKSVSLALDFHKIAREHIAKRIAHHCVTVTSGLNKQAAIAEIKKVTIDNALTLRFHNKLNHIIDMAQMAQSLNKQYLEEMTGISKLA